MTGIMRPIKKLLRDPVGYAPHIARVLLQHCCGIFQNRSFFLQGQMDIHPNSRWRALCLEQTGGFSPKGESRTIRNLEPWDNTRRDMLVLLIRSVITQRIPGAFAELGVYQGLSARLIHHYAPERPLHLFDTFEGFTGRSSTAELQSLGTSASQFSDTSLDEVVRFVASLNENVHFHKGYFPESMPTPLFSEQFAFVHLDADLYEPITEGLKFFYPRVPSRGILVVHDYNSWPGARAAVDDFFSDKSELPLPMPDKSGSAVIVKH